MRKAHGSRDVVLMLPVAVAAHVARGALRGGRCREHVTVERVVSLAGRVEAEAAFPA